MGPDETFEENALRELEEEMGIEVEGEGALQPLFDFFFQDESSRVQNWGRLVKTTYSGDIDDLTLQASEVASASWMTRAELEQLLEEGPISPDAKQAIERWFEEDPGALL